MLSLAELHALIPSWELALRAERKSVNTLKVYLTGVRQWLAWCESTGTEPRLDRRTVNAWTAHLFENGAESTTAANRQYGLRRFSAWLAEEGEIEHDELRAMRPPRIDRKVVPSITEEELERLIKSCGNGRNLQNRRDEAIIRLMAETGARAEEVCALRVDDVDLVAGSAVIRRGKGGKGRTVPLGPATCRAIDRYLRLRRTHPKAHTEALWLGGTGRTFGYTGLYRALRDRAAAAGIEGFHPHRLRHTFASRWLRAGGSETGLMAVAGWTQRDMIARYSQDTSEKRAAEEARKLNLGDL